MKISSPSLRTLSFLPLLLAASAALADPQPSFDCRKAQSAVEQAICSSDELAAYDRRLGETYALARALLPAEEKSALVQAQRKWLSEHNRACAIDAQGEVAAGAVDCLKKRYQERIASLQGTVTRGGVIVELGGDKPALTKPGESVSSDEWLFGACTEKALGQPYATDAGPGGEYISYGEANYKTYLINGRRYLLFSGQYAIQIHIPRGAYIEDENGELTAPNVPPQNYDCTLVLAEQHPGAGDYDDGAYQDNVTLGLVDYLTGSAKNDAPKNKFAKSLHDSIPGGELTLAPKQGARRHFKWNAATQWYVESK